MALPWKTLDRCTVAGEGSLELRQRVAGDFLVTLDSLVLMNSKAGGTMETFDLDGRAFVELCDLLKLTGVRASGGAAKLAIAARLVTVDGQVELRKRCKIRPGQVVACEGRRIVVRD